MQAQLSDLSCMYAMRQAHTWLLFKAGIHFTCLELHKPTIACRVQLLASTLHEPTTVMQIWQQLEHWQLPVMRGHRQR